MTNIGRIIRVNTLAPEKQRETNVIYQVAAPSAATYTGNKSYDYILQRVGSLYTFIVIDNNSNLLTTQTFEEPTEALSLSLKIQNRMKTHKYNTNINNCYLSY